MWDTNLEHSVNVQTVLCLLQSAYFTQKKMYTDHNEDEVIILNLFKIK